MDAGFEPHLRAGELSFDADDAALLRAVDEHGSLHAAAAALGRSYSRAHDRVKQLEEATGPLLDRQRGGHDGGGSRLTPGARQLLARFDRLDAALTGTIGADEIVLEGEVIDRDGELATVRTAAGPVRTILLADADDVQVTLRADAVTLHADDAVPPAEGTSALNRFRGTVEGIDCRESIAGVAVDVGLGTTLVALITLASLERLGLEVGAPVVATFKATATRATPA